MNKLQGRTLVAWSAIFCLIALSAAGYANAREITDMIGHKVTVPDSINKVYVPSPYGSYLMYSVDPAMLIGLNLSHNEDRRYLPKAAQDLPVIGGLTGQGRQSNLEVVLKAKPDIVLMWSARKSAVQGRVDEQLRSLNLPLVYAVAESLYDYPDVYLFVGKLLGREERTKRLSAYFRKTLTDVKTVVDRIPKEKRPRVYYAEGVDGLSTECNDSIHVELLQAAGDVDAHRCHTSSHQGMEKISLEQVMLYNPDVIVAQEKVFYDKVMKKKDSAWQSIKAVKEGRVYLIPHAPFNWFDRPPSFMRILGLKWLMSCLYPKSYPIDIVKEAREFYRLFLDVNVSDAEMRGIIYR